MVNRQSTPVTNRLRSLPLAASTPVEAPITDAHTSIYAEISPVANETDQEDFVMGSQSQVYPQRTGETQFLGSQTFIKAVPLYN